MDPSLDLMAESNGGYFTRAEAIDSGFSDRQLAAARRKGVVRRLRQGAYSPATIYDSCDEVQQHVILARATVARQVGSVALTGISAAAIHGLALHGQDLRTVQLVRLDNGAARREVNARHHVVNDDVQRDLTVVDGVLVTNLARTVWEVAAHSGLEAGVATADSALHQHPALAEELAALQARLGARPGSRRARVALQLADGRAESPGESYSRVLFYRHRLPMPEPQYRVVDDGGHLLAVTDFCWEEDRHVGEFDGRVKYEKFLRPGESATDAVLREKRREDLVRSELLGMTRWVWSDLMPEHSRQFIRRLTIERERSRQLYARNRTILT